MSSTVETANDIRPEGRHRFPRPLRSSRTPHNRDGNSIWCHMGVRAVPGGLISGAASYAGPDGPAERRGYPTLVQASETARDSELARRLWEASSRLTGTGQNLPAAS